MIESSGLPSFESILTRAGYDPGRHGRTRCPIHGGNNRTAFSFDEENGFFRCFSCGAKGDKVQLVRDLLRVNFGEALRWLGMYRMDFSSAKEVFPNEEISRLAQAISVEQAYRSEIFRLEFRELFNAGRNAEAVLLEFDSEGAWDILCAVAERRRWLTAAMNILDFGPPSLVVPFLIGSSRDQAEIAAFVIEAGGLCDNRQRWIECYE